jgi:hypothetical protein
MGKGLYHLTQQLNSSFDELILLRNGLILHESAILLLSIYVYQNQLIQNETIRSDEQMMKAFGAEIDAGFYIYSKPHDPLITIPMQQAYHCNLINQPMNTYQTLQQHWPTFNPFMFDCFFLKQIALINLYSYDRICEDRYIEEIEHTYNSVEQLLSGEIKQTSTVVTHKLPTLARMLRSKHIRARLLQEYEIIKSIHDLMIKELEERTSDLAK